MQIFNKISEVVPPMVDADRKKKLRQFEKSLKIRFRNIILLNLAFSHRSYSYERDNSVDDNEKLEFLGDSVLGMAVSELLYRWLPDQTEGEMARIKSFVVSEDSLAKMAGTCNVSQLLLIGKGEEISGGRSKKALLADCMEAVIGAYYLDSGYNAARSLVQFLVEPEINAVLENRHKKDYKTLLQEFAQKLYKDFPRYRIVKKKGPDHDKTFWIEVSVGGKGFGPGKGKNKKEAEQEAAGIAFRALSNES